MHSGKLLLLAFVLGIHALSSGAANLPGTAPLDAQGDLSAQMVAGIDQFLDAEIQRAVELRKNFWNRDFSSAEAYGLSIRSNRNRLRQILGAVQTRTPFTDFEFNSTSGRESKLAETETYSVYAVRWPAFDRVSGEGLWIRQKTKAVGAVICIPDADQTPEMICGLAAGLSAEGQFARTFAEQGLDVFIPVLVSRADTHSGNPEIDRFTNQPHREWIYRQAYEMGFHPIGYEVQKVLALVDWLERARHEQGRGGRLRGRRTDRVLCGRARCSHKETVMSGYFGPRERLWEEPIYRNVFGLLERVWRRGTGEHDRSADN